MRSPGMCERVFAFFLNGALFATISMHEGHRHLLNVRVYINPVVPLLAAVAFKVLHLQCPKRRCRMSCAMRLSFLIGGCCVEAKRPRRAPVPYSEALQCGVVECT